MSLGSCIHFAVTPPDIPEIAMRRQLFWDENIGVRVAEQTLNEKINKEGQGSAQLNISLNVDDDSSILFRR